MHACKKICVHACEDIHLEWSSVLAFFKLGKKAKQNRDLISVIVKGIVIVI
jgi:hypothetical protein